MATSVEHHFESNVLIINVRRTDVESLEQAAVLLADLADQIHVGVAIDLRNAPGELQLRSLLAVSEKFGGVLGDRDIRLVILLDPDSASGKVLGALVSQQDVRVLTTSHCDEARGWLSGELN